MSARLIRYGQIALVGVVAALIAAPSMTLAADEDRKFRFNLEPFEFDALFVDVDTNSSKFEEYRDMDSGGVARRVRLLGESPDGNRTLDFEIRNVARRDARYTLRYRNSGEYAVTLDYNLIPHRFGNNGTQLHSNASGRNIFTISDTTQQTLQDEVEAFFSGGGTIDFAFLGGLLQPFIDAANFVSPELERRRARAGIEIGKMSRLAWKIDLKQETRDGSRPYGSTFGFGNAIELPEPIRYDTRIAEVSGEWRAKRGGLRFGLNVSDFSNRFDTMIYDNPWRITDSTDSVAYSAPGSRSIGGPSLGRNALAPDNEAVYVFLSGHAKLGERGWLNGNLSLGRMEQDESLLAHTINTAIDTTVTDPSIRPPFDASDPANLPASTAGTKVDVMHLSLNAGVKMSSWSSVKVRARYYDYDNNSAVLAFPGYVRMDAVWEAIPRITVPYAYKNHKVGVEFGFDPLAKTHIAVGYDLLSWDRDFREVRSSDEDILHVTVDSRNFKNLVLSGGWEHGDRSTSGYDVAAQLASFTDPDERVNNQFGLRKYDEAARKYDEARASATFLAGDSVSITLGAGLRDEDYDSTVLVPDPADPDRTFPTLPLVPDEAMGLLSENLHHVNAEVAFTPNERFSLFVFGSRTNRESFQRARQSGGTVSTNPLDTWELTLEEITDTWGVGLHATLADRWTVHVSGSRSDSDGDSRFFSPPGGNPNTAESFDEYDDNKWVVYSLGFTFRVNDNVEAGLRLQHDDFVTNRFSRLNLAPYLPGSLILDLDDGDYSADLLMVGLRIRF